MFVYIEIYLGLQLLFCNDLGKYSAILRIAKNKIRFDSDSQWIFEIFHREITDHFLFYILNCILYTLHTSQYLRISHCFIHLYTIFWFHFNAKMLSLNFGLAADAIIIYHLFVSLQQPKIIYINKHRLNYNVLWQLINDNKSKYFMENIGK